MFQKLLSSMVAEAALLVGLLDVINNHGKDLSRKRPVALGVPFQALHIFGHRFTVDFHVFVVSWHEAVAITLEHECLGTLIGLLDTGSAVTFSTSAWTGQ